MNNMQNVKQQVLQELEEDEATRNDDFKLISNIYCKYYNARGVPFEVVMNGHNIHGLPAFETIRRSRQAIQAKRKDLAPCKEVAKARARNEEIYRETFRE